MKYKNWLYLLFAIVILSSCRNVMYENELIVKVVKQGDGEYQYRCYVKAFPANQVFYSNNKYTVGDTIKISY